MKKIYSPDKNFIFKKINFSNDFETKHLFFEDNYDEIEKMVIPLYCNQEIYCH